MWKSIVSVPDRFLFIFLSKFVGIIFVILPYINFGDRKSPSTVLTVNGTCNTGHHVITCNTVEVTQRGILSFDISDVL